MILRTHLENRHRSARGDAEQNAGVPTAGARWMKVIDRRFNAGKGPHCMRARPTISDGSPMRRRSGQAAFLRRPSCVSAVTPSSSPISSTILPSMTLSTVVPVKCILRPVAAGRPPARKSSNARPV